MYEDFTMKRQKRDRLGRAQSQGYKAGLNGRSAEECPYQQMEVRSYWMGGWREARNDKNLGLYK
jgi:ribosome modulation factor